MRRGTTLNKGYPIGVRGRNILWIPCLELSYLHLAGGAGNWLTFRRPRAAQECKVWVRSSSSLSLWIQGWRYLLGERFCVVCFEICAPSLFSFSLLSANFKTKHALNLWSNKYLDPGPVYTSPFLSVEFYFPSVYKFMATTPCLETGGSHTPKP